MVDEQGIIQIMQKISFCFIFFVKNIFEIKDENDLFILNIYFYLNLKKLNLIKYINKESNIHNPNNLNSKWWEWSKQKIK